MSVGDHFPAADHPDESASDIFSEHTWLQGAFLAAVAYGIEFILYVMAFNLLWIQRNQTKSWRNLFFLLYITLIFVLHTLYMAGLLQFTQESFIDGRNIPGGPNVFENVMFSLPIDMLANVIMVLITWFCDIINVWRCFVIYSGCRVPAWVVNLIPILLYLASLAFGMLFLKQVGTVSQSPWASSGINFTIPYYTMSLALNIIVTILIATRLLVYRHRITKAMGSSHGSQYTSLVAMIVESAAIYSTFALLFLIPFAVNSPVAQLFLQALSVVQGVSTILIIFRIAQGKGWSHDAYSNALSSLTPATVYTIGGSKLGSRPIRMPKGGGTFSASDQTTTTGTGDEVMMSKIQTATHRDIDGVAITKSVFVEDAV